MDGLGLHDRALIHDVQRTSAPHQLGVLRLEGRVQRTNADAQYILFGEYSVLFATSSKLVKPADIKSVPNPSIFPCELMVTVPDPFTAELGA